MHSSLTRTDTELITVLAGKVQPNVKASMTTKSETKIQLALFILREMTALRNAVREEPCVYKSPLENLEYRPEFWEDILKKISNFPKF